MKKGYLKKIIIPVILTVFSILLTGCWSYQEINEYHLVTSAAFDYEESNGMYCITTEIISLSEEKDMQQARYFSAYGSTAFDAVRDFITKTGRKLFWGHGKVVVLGKNVALKGLIPLVDMPFRDAELRGDMWLFISEEASGKEVLVTAQDRRHPLKSTQLTRSIKNSEFVSTYYGVQLWEFVKALNAEGISPTLPVVRLIKEGKENHIQVGGTAVFKKDKMVGMLDEKDTKSFLFVIDKMNHGLFKVKSKDLEEFVTLEIFDSKTKVGAELENGDIVMNINVKIKTGIAEINGISNYAEKQVLEGLRRDAGDKLKRDMEQVIEKVQKNFQSDIFYFAKYVRAHMPKYWNEIKHEWESVFSGIKTNINVEFEINSSALSFEAIKVVE